MIKLTEHQQPIFDNLWKFVQGDQDYHKALLNGPAGSGKSLLTTQLVSKIINEAAHNNIAVISPTNKALRVIKQMFSPEDQARVKFTTVHSLLGLKHKITNNGKEVYERDKSSPSKFALYDIIFVDESSMLADELFHEMEDQNYRGVKIIFIGDKNQINPVNHEHSIPMLEDQREKYGIKQYELTEIVRQAKGNPIIETSQQILKNEFQFNIGQKNVIDHQGVAILNKNQPEVINTLLKHYFCSTEFDNNADHCKVISWRNVVVDNFNQLIRGMKYGMNAPKIVIGEKLVVNRPIKGDSPDEILYNTNEDLEVLGLTVSQKELYGHQFHYYDAAVESEEEAHNIHILHEKSQKIYQQVLKKLADDAKSEKEAVRRGQKWGKYFGFQDNFSDVGFNYSITGHRAQGSTYTNCFVVYTDIRLNQNIDEQKRIFYTSCTRPREMLYIM
jgi:ATP-dependent exoDNAse (exonuclease V) alpha subunit